MSIQKHNSNSNAAKMDLPMKDKREEKKSQKTGTILYIGLYIAYKSTYGNWL